MDEFRSSEMVFLLAFAIIMLNTDLHNSNIKPDRKMKVNDFIRNLRGLLCYLIWLFVKRLSQEAIRRRSRNRNRQFI